jgi:putative tryptophan/tyrosine transport system substrate-binding protein
MQEDSTMRCSAIALIIPLALGFFVAPLTVEAQPAGPVHRIGLLHPFSSPPPSASDARAEALRQGLHDLGYVEGQNLVMEIRYAAGSEERLRALAAELVQLQVDVIVAPGVAASRAAQHATRTIPIVMAGTFDPVAGGFVASLAQPGGNITGLSYLGDELHGKRLELLKETVPQSTRIAVLGYPGWPGYASVLNHLTVAARALGLHLHVVEVHRADELDHAFTVMTGAGAEAVLVMEDAVLLNSQRGRVVADLAATHRLPVLYAWREWVVAGCLMSYGPNSLDTLRRAATYVDKILKGAKPADLPVEQPMKFELVLNLKTAAALGIAIPPSLLLLADEVIR